MFLKRREILKDYKSDRNPLKMLKAPFLVMLQTLNLQLCQKKETPRQVFFN